MAKLKCKCGEKVKEGMLEFPRNYLHHCKICNAEGCDKCMKVPQCVFCEHGFCEKHIAPKDHKCPEANVKDSFMEDNEDSADELETEDKEEKED